MSSHWPPKQKCCVEDWSPVLDHWLTITRKSFFQIHRLRLQAIQAHHGKIELPIQVIWLNQTTSVLESAVNPCLPEVTDSPYNLEIVLTLLRPVEWKTGL